MALFLFRNENFQSQVQTETPNQLQQQSTLREIFSTPSSNGGDHNRYANENVCGKTIEFLVITLFSFSYTPLPQLRETRVISHSEFAIKPASHTTERHSVTCLMSHQDRSTSTYHTPPCQREELLKHNAYSGFNEEMRVAVAQPCKLHREVADFETWRTKIDEVCFHIKVKRLRLCNVLKLLIVI